MEMAIVFLVGVLFGCLLVGTILHRESVGKLRIDTSDPYDGPYMFLELSRSVDQVYRKKYVLLEVDTENFVSQE